MTSVPVAYRMLAGLKNRQTGRSWRFIIAWSRARRPARSCSKLISLRLGTRGWWMRGRMASRRPCSVITGADLLPLGAARRRGHLGDQGIAASVDQPAPVAQAGEVGVPMVAAVGSAAGSRMARGDRAVAEVGYAGSVAG